MGRLTKPEWVTVIQEDNDLITVVNTQTGGVFLTNPIGRRILDLCDGQRDSDALIQALQAEFQDVDASTVSDDVTSFLQMAFEKGVIVHA